jgi:hypothetical protein
LFADAAVFLFIFANLSFYLVMTMFTQKGCRFHRCSRLVFLPLALTFVIASRHSGGAPNIAARGCLIEGCAVQIAGLAAWANAIGWIERRLRWFFPWF